jgi:hypothetical protein
VGYEKTIEAILVNKRILENDKSNMKTQMDNQTLEINNLNRKLKENFVELQKLISDKKLLEEQLVNH